MSSDEDEDYPTSAYAAPAPRSPGAPAIRDLENEQGYSDDDEQDEPLNDAGRDDRVADRTGGVAPEDVDDDDVEQDPPARRDRNDDDDDDDEDEEEDDEPRTAPAPAAKKSDSRGADNDDEDDEDEEDDEDDDEEEDARGKTRKSKKRRLNRFIDIEAEVDDEEEDEDEEEDFGGAAADFIEQGELPERDFDDRQHRAFDRLEAERGGMDAQEIARELRERYRNSNREYDGSANFSDRKANMPTSQDPKLWQVRCKAGQERTVITTICLKGFAAADRGEDFGIFSAFERDSLPGTIFVEAYGRDHVARALQGVSNVYLQAARSGGEEQKNTITLIENRDMVPLLTMKKKEVTPKRNMWVRIKRGKYTGDLAQIVEIMGDGQTVAVLLVPRIDYNPERSQQERKRKQGKANTLASRPTQSLFRPNTIAEVYGRGAFREEAGRYLFQGEEFTQAGLLDKEYPVASILTENINPTLNEIAKFQGDNADHGETLSKFNLDAIAEAAKKTAGSNIRPGDQIEAAEGELAGLKGVVETVTGEVVLVRFPSRELHGNHEDQLIELPAKSVRKIFRVGDHVKVMQGVNVNDTGMVLSVDQNVVTFFSDLSQKEVKAFSRDLREAATIGALNNRVGNFELHDLVTIDAQTVGVIFQTERDGFKVVDQNGSIRSVRPHQITKQPIQISRRTVGMDHKDREFRMGDQMKEVEGEYRKGLVLHVYRGLFTFLHSRDIVENSGVFVVRSKNLGPVDERVTTKSGPDLKKQDPSLNQAAPIITGPQAANRRHLINTHVVIVKGTKKGLQGIIKDTQGDNARVELKTDNKVVTVPIASLKKKDPRTQVVSALEEKKVGAYQMAPAASNPYAPSAPGQNPYAPVANPFSQTPYAAPYNTGGQTANPFAGGQTANPYALGAATPYLGAATPYGGGGKTPFDGGKTPFGGGKTPFDGGKTPFMGGRTPAYPTAATPFGRPAYGQPNGYGGGSTPMINSYAGAAAAPSLDPNWSRGLERILIKVGDSLVYNPYGQQRFDNGRYNGQPFQLVAHTPEGAQCQSMQTSEMKMIPYEYLHPFLPESPGQSVVITTPEDKGRRAVTASGDRTSGVWTVQEMPGRQYSAGQLCRTV